MASDCLGLGLKMSPNRSKSYLEAPVCIISTAQQASPKVMGHKDPRRAQFKRSSTFDITKSAALHNPVGLDVVGGADPVYGFGKDEAEVEYGIVDVVV